jgi:hypothetical protein
MELDISELLSNYSFNNLKTLKNYIDKYIEYKIYNDIINNNDLELCIIPNIKYGNIYIDDKNLQIKICKLFPKILKSEFDERRYVYIDGIIENIKNQELINLILLNNYINDDFIICLIPTYLNNYDDIYKYHHLYKKINTI